MSSAVELTISICTKNRLADVWRCIRALCRTENKLAVEILIVDDGETPATDLAAMRELAEGAGFAFRYHRKTSDFGLFNSRLLSREFAYGDVILFLDDDAELEEGYLARLIDHYRHDRTLVGVGGIDTLANEPTLAKSLFARTFLVAADSPGRLTASAFNGSLVLWKQQSTPFDTEFLSGCNMSFRRAALADLVPYEWLSGYSLGEDLVVSFHASRHGRLLVDPLLRVKHHVSPTNRLKRQQLAYHAVINSYEIGRMVRPGLVGRVASAWTFLGLLLKNAIRPGHHKEALMTLRGIGHLVTRSLSSHD